jgi:hypothetical protein
MFASRTDRQSWDTIHISRRDPMQRLIPRLLTVAATLLPLAAAADTAPVLTQMNAADFASPMPNPWYPLVAGTTRRFLSPGNGADLPPELTVTKVEGPGPVITGVATVKIVDRAYVDGIQVELAIDYLATDNSGNLWYFGEEVTNYLYDADGQMTGTDHKGTWLAGQNGALPGILLSAQPTAGQSLFQEYAKADGALDFGTVLATGLTLDGPAGHFENIVQQLAGTTLDPTSVEVKYYAPGIGLVREEEGLATATSPPERTADLQP